MAVGRGTAPDFEELARQKAQKDENTRKEKQKREDEQARCEAIASARKSDISAGKIKRMGEKSDVTTSPLMSLAEADDSPIRLSAGTYFYDTKPAKKFHIEVDDNGSMRPTALKTSYWKNLRGAMTEWHPDGKLYREAYTTLFQIAKKSQTNIPIDLPAAAQGKLDKDMINYNKAQLRALLDIAEEQKVSVTFKDGIEHFLANYCTQQEAEAFKARQKALDIHEEEFKAEHGLYGAKQHKKWTDKLTDRQHDPAQQIQMKKEADGSFSFNTNHYYQKSDGTMMTDSEKLKVIEDNLKKLDKRLDEASFIRRQVSKGVKQDDELASNAAMKGLVQTRVTSDQAEKDNTLNAIKTELQTIEDHRKAWTDQLTKIDPATLPTEEDKRRRKQLGDLAEKTMKTKITSEDRKNNDTVANHSTLVAKLNPSHTPPSSPAPGSRPGGP